MQFVCWTNRHSKTYCIRSPLPFAHAFGFFYVCRLFFPSKQRRNDDRNDNDPMCADSRFTILFRPSRWKRFSTHVSQQCKYTGKTLIIKALCTLSSLFERVSFRIVPKSARINARAVLKLTTIVLQRQRYRIIMQSNDQAESSNVLFESSNSYSSCPLSKKWQTIRRRDVPGQRVC